MIDATSDEALRSFQSLVNKAEETKRLNVGKYLDKIAQETMENLYEERRK